MRNTRLTRGGSIAVAAAALALLLQLSGVLTGIEQVTYDMRVRLLARSEPAATDTVLILVDQSSLQWGLENQGQSWPWPRTYYAVITDFARRAGAASLTFDVIFEDDSFYGVSDDQTFAEAADRFGRTAVAAFYGEQRGRYTAFPDYVPQSAAALALPGLDRSRMPRLSQASFPVPELSRTARAIGNVRGFPDADGVYRRIPPLAEFDDALVPSLALAAYLADAREDAARSVDGKLALDGTVLPLDTAGNLVVHFDLAREARQRYSAAAIIQSELHLAAGGDTPLIDPAQLAGRHLLVGLSASGLYDQRPLPISGEALGVEFHAAMLENFLSGSYLQQPGAASTLIYLMLLSALGAFGVSLSRRTGTSAAAIAATPLLPAAIALGGYSLGWWLPAVVPATAGIIGGIAAAVLNYASEGRERRFIKSAFSQYLSPIVIDRLLKDPKRLELGGERRDLTIFFSDLQGFTSLSEGLSPDELTQLLNEYLTAMTDIIIGSGGTIDKYEGDAIIAFWNAPVDVPDHPAVGVNAALQCQQRLAELRPVFQQRVGKELHMRIGLNTGPAVVGNMGSRQRFDYTMLGDAVNLAARLEGNNKQFGTYTMISAYTAARLPETIPCRELGRIAVVGRARPVQVFEPMLQEDYARRRRNLEAFAAALQQYYQGNFGAARQGFAQLPEDPAARSYHDRCAQLAKKPPPEWDGVWIMDSK
ncbi:CHASE2 domain-containing protein [Spirochaeta africana]|nr:adenylate/guanylate cyclase domain-containing protein [Spirochaeta africana]